MRFDFSCGAGSLSVGASGLFSRYAIRVAIREAARHVASCPYCQFRKDALDMRLSHDTRKDVG